MIQALYTGSSGVTAQQMRLDIIANNMSNVDTNGYKSVRVDFRDALYQAMRRPVQPQDALNLQLGHGVHVSATTRFFVQGSMQTTGRPLDIAIEGKTFFGVICPDGIVRYTRDGNFHISTEEGGDFLVDSSGNYLVSPEGEKIAVNGGDTHLAVGRHGAISYKGMELDEDGQAIASEPYATIAQFSFTNPEGLSASGANLFEATGASGEATLAEELADLHQGVQEMSTVDMAMEMTRLIRTQRAYQFAGKVVQTADEMENIANNLRR